ncbi:MAG: HD domain-containing protein [Rhodospirillaceae bacterium]|nr:MAG: HD domain-containing protein [Rhodospirillaceae bacterium]
MSKTVSFLQMKDGTREDYLLLDQSERNFATGLPSRVMESLAKLDHSLEGYKVSRLEHSLQTATRAEADGADDEMIVAALIHDIGDELAPYNHAEIAAGMIRPYVRAEVTWVVEQHGIFQMYYYAHHLGGDRNARNRFRDHPWYASCERFCERWDQAAFDPDYTSKPLSYWEPLVRDIFGRQAHDPRYVKSAA